MSPDPEPHFSPAPPPAVDERSVKTVTIARPGTGFSTKKLILGLLAFALVAGVVVAAVAKGYTGGASASASADVAAVTEGSDEAVVEAKGPDGNVAIATAPTGSKPAECLGEITDPSLRYYCDHLLPFATKASADHDRLDRIEPIVQRLDDAGSPGVPLALWAVLAGFGLLTMINTLLILSMKRKKKEATPPGA